MMRKMKQINLLILVIMPLIACNSQKNFPIEPANLYPIGKHGLWGYANSAGDIMIPYQFESATFFIGDRASVKKDGKYGFINKRGEFLIKPEYDSIGYFNSDQANVIKNGKKLTINRRGQRQDEGILISFCGTGIEYVSNPLDYFKEVDDQYVLRSGEFEQQRRLDPAANFQISDFTFDEVIPFSARSVIIKKNNKYDIYVHFNYVGLKGIWADEIVPYFGDKHGSGEMIAAQNAKYRIGDTWGIVTSLGQISVEPEFHSIKDRNGIYYLVEYRHDHWGWMTGRNRYFKTESETPKQSHER